MGCAGNAPERFESIEQLDAQLLSVGLEEAGLRLRLGQVLEVMQRTAGCCELGFSSLAAYALERCERSARWVEVACCLARRLEVLPLLRRAVATGRISWSKAELLARVAQPETEAHWLELAERHTLRELRREVIEARSVASADGADSADAPDSALTEEREATGVLTCTLDREDAWLLEATRALLDQLGTRGAEEQVEALLAEGQGALLAALPAGALDLEGLESTERAQQRWREQLACWRSEAELRCEPRIRAAVLERAESSNAVSLLAAQGMSSLEGWQSRELDGEVRRLAAALAGHELELSRLLGRFHRADGWRRLGYATETQYARERLGLSRSSLLARRSLALRLEALRLVASALGRAEVGVEAALQLVRIATPQTELAWLERARQRTVKHLREEVSAALSAVRLSGESDCPPPRDEELERFQELERAVLSGRVLGGIANRRQPDCAAEPTAEQPTGSHPSLARNAEQPHGLARARRARARRPDVCAEHHGRARARRPDVCAEHSGRAVEVGAQRRAGRGALAGLARLAHVVALARGVCSALAAAWAELGEVSLPGVLAGLVPHGGSECRVGAGVSARSLPLLESGVQPQGRHAASSAFSLGGRQ